MFRSTLFSLFLMFMSGMALAQPTFQDCLGAIPVCSDSITIGMNHNGMGNYGNEIANVSNCYAPEQRSVWFTWTVQQSGLLRFAIIQPAPIKIMIGHFLILRAAHALSFLVILAPPAQWCVRIHGEPLVQTVLQV